MAAHIREGLHAVTPRLITSDVAGLVDFLRVTFDARGEVLPGFPVEMKIQDSTILISDGGGLTSAVSGFLYVYVADTDATFRTAIEAGAEIIERPSVMPWGDRRATVADRWGNLWQIATWLGGSN